MNQPAPKGAAPHAAAASSAPELIIYIDGGARGNPGPAGYGVVIQDAAGATVDTLARSIGRATNNVAEYSALLAGLEYAVEKGARTVQIYCDSELVVRQMQGRYRVQSPDLKPLYLQARELAGRLKQFRITHVPREQNALADELANQAMDGAPRHPAAVANASGDQRLVAVYENGLLRPLTASPALQEGVEYEVHLRRRR